MYGWDVALDSHDNDEMHVGSYQQVLVLSVVDRI